MPRAWWIGLCCATSITGCGGRSGGPPPTAGVASTGGSRSPFAAAEHGGPPRDSTGASRSIAAELVDPGAAPPRGKVVALDSAANLPATTIDDAGIAWEMGAGFLGTTARWIPFSGPVAELVVVKSLSMANQPGARMAWLFCGRLRASTVECVVDFEATLTEPRETRRFALPFDGDVLRIGVHTPAWRSGTEPDKAVCGLTERGGSCWSFAWDGRSATTYAIDAASAASVAVGLVPSEVPAWQRATPDMVTEKIREVVHSDADDARGVIPRSPRDTGTRPTIRVSCARLEGGTVHCFGPGVFGELGDGLDAITLRASRPLGDARVVDVAMSGHHACAVLADGKIACWGALPAHLPVPKRRVATGLPMCTFDRAGSVAAFEAARTADHQRAAQCGAACGSRSERDACLGCVTSCVPLVYRFRHDRTCQEPYLEATLTQQGIGCARPGEQARWLSDRELRAQAPAIDRTLAPVTLRGINDAVALALPVSGLCVLRRSGVVACVDADGNLSTKP